MNKLTGTLLSTLVIALSLPAAYVYAAQQSETDSRIESAAEDSYVFKTYLKDDAVKVKSENGIVTLKGTVNQDAHLKLANETVANLPGVKSVDNQLESRQEKLSEESDGWIGVQVKTSLLFNRHVSGLKTHVSVKEGVVTLTGIAGNRAQKDLAGEYAKDIRGVKSVQNEMTVAEVEKPSTMVEKIDDASITAQAKTALLMHRSTSALKTSVETQDGVVTLGGNVGSEAEKSLAAKIVGNIHGVSNVINNMKIDYTLSKS